MTVNRYIDTRNNVIEPVTFTQAVINGLAPQGGLYVPEKIPTLSLDDILSLSDVSYAECAARIYKAFEIDLPETTIEEITKRAYGENFDEEDICPISSVGDNFHVLELWHGPTSAFKDMALQCLPLFFSASAKKLREEGQLDDEHMILVATSGDTGKAALAGFADVDGVSIGVMYPKDGVSDIQYKQMATQAGDNVMVWAVEGNFDDCQTGAKNVFNDNEFAAELHTDNQISLSSANSINWGRLMPQIVYYVSAYSRLVAAEKIEAGSPIDICVPTGNFGNILAAYYAKQIGTPIRHLICASNENRVLSDFINTGTYDISDREFVKTPSPSMDILVSSNLERQLFELTNRDGESISKWMKDLRENNRFQIDKNTYAKIRETYLADSVDNETCLKVIKRVFEDKNYLLDPHTAVAYHVAELVCDDDVPVVIASTAHWAKFGSSVYRALHGLSFHEELPAEIAELSGCDLNKRIASETNADFIPEGLSNLDNMPIRFTKTIEGNTDSIEQAVREFLNELSK